MGYERLKMVRKRMGYTQAQLASLLGLATRNAYALKERGERRFSVDEGLVIACALGMSVEALFSGNEVNETDTNERGGHENGSGRGKCLRSI
ncbi:MAG: helix-turn-helix domain-containing protein [Clostridia bacterium]